MSNVTVSLQLPRDLLGALNIPETQLVPQILELLALELFRQEQISVGKAAELLSISKWEFVQLLARHKIPYFTESADELMGEVTAVEEILSPTHCSKQLFGKILCKCELKAGRAQA